MSVGGVIVWTKGGRYRSPQERRNELDETTRRKTWRKFLSGQEKSIN